MVEGIQTNAAEIPLYQAGTMQLNLITLGGENLYGDAVGSPLAGAFPRRAQAR